MLGLNISVASCVGSQRGGFMVLCDLVLILRGMRGYEQPLQRGETSDTEEPNENQRGKPRGKSQREEAATTSALAVVDDHSDALQRRTNNPVATRTVFTTRIWDLYWNSSSIAHDGRPKSAQSVRTS